MALGLVDRKAPQQTGEQSISILAVEDAQKGHGNDLQIEGEAPVAKIVQVIFHTLFDRRVSAPSVYLCPAGDSDFEGVAKIIALDFLQEPLHKMCSFRSRTDDAHVPSQYVEELGKFVEICFPQQNTYRRPSWIVVAGPTRIPFLAASYPHGAKLQHAEHAAVEPDTLLDEKDRTRARHFNGERD